MEAHAQRDGEDGAHASPLEREVEAALAVLRAGGTPELARHAERAAVILPAFENALGERMFEEFLVAQEPGGDDPVRVLALADRAGGGGRDLRERVALYRELGDIGAVLARGEASEPPTTGAFGSYRVLGELGAGGLSRVLLAESDELGRRVAIKVLREDALDGLDAERWMRTEGRSLARLEHPCVVRVHEVARIDGCRCIVMEHVEGATLQAVIAALRALAGGGSLDGHSEAALAAARVLESLPARIRLAARLARALEHCHARGVVHRDVKPSNVIVDASGAPKLIDFGLAHLESEESLGLTEKLVGTAGYISPEQVEHSRSGADPLSDQFPLGTVLYELVTLRHPFASGTRTATLDAIARAELAPPRAVCAEISPELDQVLRHALERTPSERYSSMGPLAADLEAILEHRPVGVRPPSPARRLALWSRRHATSLRAAGASALVAIVVFTGVHVRGRVLASESLRAEARAILARVPEAVTALDFANIGEDLVQLTRHSRELEAGILSSGFRDPVDEVGRAFADRVAHVLDERLAHVELMHWATYAEAAVYDEFASVIAKADELGFAGPSLQPHCGRGEMDFSALPSDLAISLARHVPLSPGLWRELEPYPAWGELPPGCYRITLRAPEGEIIAERDFDVARDFPRRVARLVSTPPLAELGIPKRGEQRDLLVRELPADVPGAVLVDGAPAYRLAVDGTWEREEGNTIRLLVLERVVSIEDAMAVLGATAVHSRIDSVLSQAKGGLTFEDLDPRRPVVLTPVEAMEYASRIGGRLPTAAELVAILAANPAWKNVTVNLAPESNGLGITRELSSAQSLDSPQFGTVSYQDGPMNFVVAKGTAFRTAFRVVFPLRSSVADEPLER